MKEYTVFVTHNEDSLKALAHMQYDLFETRNFIVRSILSLVLIGVGAVYFSRVWGIALMAYGCYLMTSTYSAADYRVRKLVRGIQASGKGFPSSRYRFTEDRIEILYHPGEADEEELSPVGYGEILRLGEDRDYYYLFPNANGGYCIPKDQLGEQRSEFVSFLEEKTGK